MQKKPLGLFFLALAAPISLKEGSRQGHRLHFKLNTHMDSTAVISDLPHLLPATENSSQIQVPGAVTCNPSETVCVT